MKKATSSEPEMGFLINIFFTALFKLLDQSEVYENYFSLHTFLSKTQWYGNDIEPCLCCH